MKLKNVLTRKQLEKFATTLLADINEDFVGDVFQDIYSDPDTLITFSEVDFSDDEDLVAAMADAIGNIPCEESD